jgi:hypothetical protein
MRRREKDRVAFIFPHKRRRVNALILFPYGGICGERSAGLLGALDADRYNTTMARRLYKTTADYLAIAVSPALIMALVTSLVFFLLLVFYRGQWQGRLQYIMFLFIFAAVLIARIAMEEGREKAMLYSVFLGGATAFTVGRFSDLGLFINLGLLGLIWWCADRLTWDCTLIDEHENASGEGLLQTVGLDEPAAEPRAALQNADVEPLGVTSRDHASDRKTWWRRVWEHFHKPRSPGVWVVYFSLAALPIFGFGQKFISGDDARRAAFRYLVIYVASALGLLLMTCFLGLRRYLRQRRVEMPDRMAVVWVATGCTLIVALLIFCLLLPRRNPVRDIAESAPPVHFSSPTDLVSSWMGWGDKGIKEDDRSGTAADAGQQGHAEHSNEHQSDSSDNGGKSDGRKQPGERGGAGEKQSDEKSQGQGSSAGQSKSPSEDSSTSGAASGQKQESSSSSQNQGGHQQGKQSSGPSSKSDSQQNGDQQRGGQQIDAQQNNSQTGEAQSNNQAQGNENRGQQSSEKSSDQQSAQNGVEKQQGA